MKKPSILIATPAYGGMVTTQYVNSLIPTMTWLHDAKHPYQHYTLCNESLIPRGRNQCAWYALTHGPEGRPFDKLLFIDADLGWEWQWVQRLLESNKLLVGGTYPMKQYPIGLAANSLPSDRHLFGAKRSMEELQALAEALITPEGVVEMLHIPTGFMMIDTQVLIDLMPHVSHYRGMDWRFGTPVRMWDFFPIGVSASHEDPELYESEDWAFCSLVRKHLGCGVWLDPSILPTHTGTHTFRAGHTGVSHAKI